MISKACVIDSGNLLHESEQLLCEGGQRLEGRERLVGGSEQLVGGREQLVGGHERLVDESGQMSDGNGQLLYRMALTRIRGIGPVQTKKLVGHFGDAAKVFCAPMGELLAAGLTLEVAEAILAFDDHEKLAAELELLEKRSIRLLFFTDPEYPRRLLMFKNAPPLLYYKGNADLNAQRILAVVGTRSPDNYGRHLTDEVIKQLASFGIMVISGLALGIDAAAHEAAIANNLPTVGVLGQGLGTDIYPWQNAGLAGRMLRHGGLLSFFPYHENSSAHNFPKRNCLVAGLCDALLVVQTKRNGGSMLTAADAKTYGKEIFAIPGRPTDKLSTGCNWLIQRGDAKLFFSAEQLVAATGWIWPDGGMGVQTSLAFEPDSRLPAMKGGGLEGDRMSEVSKEGNGEEDVWMEARLLAAVREKEGAGIDELAVCSELDASVVALVLLRLELRGSVIALPGKRYMLTPRLGKK